MKILISEIPDEGLEIEVDEKLEWNAVRLTSPVKGMLRISKVGPEVVVQGDITAGAELECGRCLKGFSTEIDAPVNVMYRPVDELKGSGQHEVREDELETGFYSGDELDLAELVKEQIVLNMPMKPLCSDECRGICPKCGTDLNLNRCDCDAKEVDSRLEILKGLLRRE